MSITAEKTVREVALENPAATRVFEKLGIDYCCGGNKSLEEACRTVNLPMDEVLDSLEMAEQSARAVQKDRNWTWQSADLSFIDAQRDGIEMRSPQHIVNDAATCATSAPGVLIAGDIASGYYSTSRTCEVARLAARLKLSLVPSRP